MSWKTVKSIPELDEHIKGPFTLCLFYSFPYFSDIKALPSKLESKGIACIQIDTNVLQEVVLRYNIKDYPAFQYFKEGKKYGEMSNDFEKVLDIFKNYESRDFAGHLNAPLNQIPDVLTSRVRKNSVSSTRSNKSVDKPNPTESSNTETSKSASNFSEKNSDTPSIGHFKENSLGENQDRRKSMVASTNSCTSDSKIRKSRANSLSRKLPVNTIQVLDNNDKSSVFINTPTSMQNMQELDFLVENIIRQSECLKLDKDGVTLIEPTVSKEDDIIKPVVPATLSAPSFILELTHLPQSTNAIENSDPFTQALKNIDATERESPAVELRIDVRKSRSRSNSRSKSPIEPFETIRETEVFGNDTLETTLHTRKSKTDSYSEKADQFVSTPLRKEVLVQKKSSKADFLHQ
ncbi:hypothetical protein HK103_001395 [Boothiomyces macroporosus]|uniref:Thioredoxin domain-containing protein n=1 Tax=Boothiomyces macroporosus TaxID=261099 RepID=A0AAD5Y337_9FUNG|nr:hypothetical protein HK103_001395 [Boothiomyces macroporosus]